MQSPFSPRTWPVAHDRELLLGPKAIIMAIINVTPDSFSDGGRHGTVDQAVSAALKAVEEGASIIDIGGESTRPGAAAVSEQEELDRVIPVIEALSAKTDAIISIDTYRAETARRAIAAGAHIINDVHGLQKEPEIADVGAQSGAGIVVMHTGRGRDVLTDPVADQRYFFGKSLAIAHSAGIANNRIVLDPGFGFAKETVEDNLVLVERFEELLAIGYSLLVGTSRKRFIGTITGRQAEARDVATAASNVILRSRGAALFRVHDVAINRDALLVADAMIAR